MREAPRRPPRPAPARRRRRCGALVAARYALADEDAARLVALPAGAGRGQRALPGRAAARAGGARGCCARAATAGRSATSTRRRRCRRCCGRSSTGGVARLGDGDAAAARGRGGHRAGGAARALGGGGRGGRGGAAATPSSGRSRRACSRRRRTARACASPTRSSARRCTRACWPLRRRALHRRVGEALAAERASPDPDAVAYHFQQAGDPRAVAWLIAAGERAQAAYRLAHGGRALRGGAGAAGGARGPRAERAAGSSSPRACCAASPIRGRRCATLEEAARLAAAAGDARAGRRARASSRGHCSLRHAGRVGGADGGDWRRRCAALDALPARTRRRAARGAERCALAPATAPTHRAGSLASLPRRLGAMTGRCAGRGDRRAMPRPPGRARPAFSARRRMSGSAPPTRRWGSPDAARRAWARHAARAATHSATAHHGRVHASARAAAGGPALPADRVAGRRGWRPRRRWPSAARGASAARRDLAHRTSATCAVLARWRRGRRRSGCARHAGAAAPPVHALGDRGCWARWRAHQGDARARLGAWCARCLPDGPGDRAGATPTSTTPSRCRRLAAQLALDAGDLAGAQAWLAAHDRWLAWSGAVLGRAEGQLGWARYHRAAGDPAQARAARRGAPWRTPASRASRSPSSPPTALLGELDTAAGRHADARSAPRRRPGAGRRLRRALRARPDPARPGRAARRRPATATARGRPWPRRAPSSNPLEARPALARADALAARLAAPPPPPAPRRLPFGLTAREAEVLRLVAAGARQRRRSPTASSSARAPSNTHLRSIYDKLGVDNRAAATRRRRRARPRLILRAVSRIAFCSSSAARSSIRCGKAVATM